MSILHNSSPRAAVRHWRRRLPLEASLEQNNSGLHQPHLLRPTRCQFQVCLIHKLVSFTSLEVYASWLLASRAGRHLIREAPAELWALFEVALLVVVVLIIFIYFHVFGSTMSLSRARNGSNLHSLH